MNKVNKLAGTLLAACLLSATPAWANEPVKSSTAQQQQTKQELPAHLKPALEKVFTVMPEWKALQVRFVVSSEADSMRPALWHVNLTSGPVDAKPEEDDKYITARVSLDAKTGALYSLDFAHPEWASEKTPSAALAKEKAEAFLKQLLGDNMKHYKVNEEVFPTQRFTPGEGENQKVWSAADVIVERLVNGIPVQDYGYRVQVDANGRIIGLESNEKGEDLSKFPAPTGILTEEQAADAYMSQGKMKLMYNSQQTVAISSVGQGDRKTAPVLKYIFTGPYMIDAKTGKTPEPLARFAEREEKIIKLAPKGEKLVAKSAEEVAKLVKDRFGVDVTGLKLNEMEGVDIFSSGKKLKTFDWHSDYSKTDQIRTVSVDADAETGEVVRFSVHDKTSAASEQKPTATKEQAVKTAVSYLEKILSPKTKELQLGYVSTPEENKIPDWVDKSKLKKWSQYNQTPDIYVGFSEMHQGIPLEREGYSVRIDAVTGKVIGLNLTEKDASVTLPDAKNAVKPEEAAKEYQKNLELSLVYFWEEFEGQRAPQPILVYRAEDEARNSYFDALTGKRVEISTK